MSIPDREIPAVQPSPQRARLHRLVIAASLAVLGAGAVYEALRSPFASAEPRSAPASESATPAIQESLTLHPANADADVGPGNAEPVLVSSP